MNNGELNIRNKVRGTRFVAHFLALCILFFLPEVLFSIGKPMGWGMIYFRPFTYILIFYLNYYFLVDKFFFDKKKKWFFFLINFILVFGIVVAIYALSRVFAPDCEPKMGPPRPPHFMNPEPDFLDRHALKMFSFLLRDGVMLILTVTLSVAMKLGEKWVKWDNMQRDLIAERQETELKNLKSQLNPHFLFNTLNNIYSLIAISQTKAQKSVHDLSNLLRYVLYDNNDKEVELIKDLRFIQNYIELMRLRLGSNVTLDVNIQEAGIDGLKVAPLLFMSLIENAFKHGVSTARPSFIKINIFVKDNHLIGEVSNSYFPKNENDKSGSGIGLQNLKRQLSILYPSRYSLSNSRDEEVYKSVLDIELTPID